MLSDLKNRVLTFSSALKTLLGETSSRIVFQNDAFHLVFFHPSNQNISSKDFSILVNDKSEGL